MNNPNKRFTKLQGIPTTTNIITALALITWGTAYTKHTPTWALTLLALTLTALLALAIARKIQTNERRYLLPNDYAEQLEAHAKYTINPRHISLSKFRTHTKNPFATGTPQRITLKHGQVRPIDVTDFSEIINTLNLATGNVYTINRKKSKDRGLLVLDALTPEQLLTKNTQPELTFRENTEKRLHTAANNLLGENTTITAHWQDDEYLTNVEITGFDSTIIALPNKRKQILMQLRSTLPKGDFNTFADPHEQKIRFFRSKPLPTVTAPPAQRARLIKTNEDYLKLKIPYGIGADNQIAEWKPSKDAHLLITGATGAGKTIFMHTIVQGLCQAGARVWIVDGKYIEFKGYRDYPNVELLAQTIEHQVRVVKMVNEIMWERYTLVRDNKVSIAELEPIFLVIDEVKTFLLQAEYLYEDHKVKGMPSKSKVLKWLSEIGSLARTAKIHMVFGLQRPDADILGSGEFRDNFTARVSLGQLNSSHSSIMMWNNPAIGVQVPKIPGRAISYVDGVPGQIQVPFCANPDPQHKDFVPSMVAANYPVWEIYSRKTIADAKPEMLLDKNGEPTGESAITWDSIISAKVVDPKTGLPVEIPVIASDESRALRASDAHDAPAKESDLVPREINDFARALSIFDDTTNLSWGSSVARALVAFKHLEKSDYENSETKAAEAYAETQKRLANSELAFDEEREIKSSEVTGGMRVTDPATGEKILVSDTQQISESDQVIVTGYTEDGEQVSIEVDAGQKLECAALLEV